MKKKKSRSRKKALVSHLTIANAINAVLRSPDFSCSEQTLRLSWASMSDYGKDDADLVAVNWLRQNLLSKSHELDMGKGHCKKSAAKAAFLVNEATCTATNHRILETSPNWRVAAVIKLAAEKISECLGDFSLDDLLLGSRFSGGASVTRPRLVSHAAHKFGDKISRSVTPLCYPYAVAMVRASPVWERRIVALHGPDPRNWFKVYAGNRVTTVPKNAKTDRTIAIENDMNMYVQLGLGAMLRSRLKKVGINLDSQLRNQELARIGSRTGNLATVDLSAASDTVSLEVVRLLMPSDWFVHLDRCRAHIYPSGDGFLRYAKVSSMGNGFTFELESLLFWAITSACRDLSYCVDRRLTIYGDDIIVGTEAVPLLRESFAYLGFSFNADKSFVDGSFRESCGKHYFNGRDVSPFYLKDRITLPVHAYRLANRWREWCFRFDGCTSGAMYRTWQAIVSAIPERLRLFIPDGYGDTGIVASFDEARPRVRRSITTVVQLQPQIYRTAVTMEGAYIYRLSSVGSTVVKVRKNHKSAVESGTWAEDVTPLSKVHPDRYSPKRLVVPVWNDPYPWCITEEGSTAPWNGRVIS